MSTQRVGDPPVPCLHPEHRPPMHRAYPPGRHVHTCPGCGETRPFTIYAPPPLTMARNDHGVDTAKIEPGDPATGTVEVDATR